MSTFEKTSKMDVDEAFLKKCQAEMDAVCVNEAQRFAVIKGYFKSDKYILDPHSSIGVGAVSERTFSTPIVCLACAHWAKFPDAIRTSLESLSESVVEKAMDTPAELKMLFSVKERQDVLEHDSSAVKAFMTENLPRSSEYDQVYYPGSDKRQVLWGVAFVAAAAMAARMLNHK